MKVIYILGKRRVTLPPSFQPIWKHRTFGYYIISDDALLEGL